jgi:hypothetical protein
MFLILVEKNGKHTMRTAKYSKTRFLFARKQIVKMAKK